MSFFHLSSFLYSSLVPGDAIKLASSTDSSKQLLADSLPCENAAPLGAAELTAARYSKGLITVMGMESNCKLPCVTKGTS